mmetsp:Transcript_18926/g.41145  ORF Transcript_18926/g.41145 Transcript_18926/m.41145 type:complete len:327 (-) Transcript_18926:805-1785(-)
MERRTNARNRIAKRQQMVHCFRQFFIVIIVSSSTGIDTARIIYPQRGDSLAIMPENDRIWPHRFLCFNNDTRSNIIVILSNRCVIPKPQPNRSPNMPSLFGPRAIGVGWIVSIVIPQYIGVSIGGLAFSTELRRVDQKGDIVGGPVGNKGVVDVGLVRLVGDHVRGHRIVVPTDPQIRVGWHVLEVLGLRRIGSLGQAIGDGCRLVHRDVSAGFYDVNVQVLAQGVIGGFLQAIFQQRNGVRNSWLGCLLVGFFVEMVSLRIGMQNHDGIGQEPHDVGVSFAVAIRKNNGFVQVFELFTVGFVTNGLVFKRGTESKVHGVNQSELF